MLRLHRGYASAPDRVLGAIVRFLDPRVPRVLRRVAEREFLGFPVEEYAPPPAQPPAARPAASRATSRCFNGSPTCISASTPVHFGGALSAIPIRLSGRMRTRLGELTHGLPDGLPGGDHPQPAAHSPAPWAEVEHTLLHEMVHQWQAESGLAVNHGSTFKRKARELGIEPQARRRLPHPISEAAGA